MITIVDYGLGNIGAFESCYRRLNIETRRASTAQQLESATHIILPGVGAFDTAVGLLNASGMRERLDELVLEKRTPVLGICVGMQMLGTGSDEGSEVGLGWVPGKSTLFPKTCKPIPHLGWNDVTLNGPDIRLFSGLEAGARFYFLHSYFFQPESQQAISAQANYGFKFACALSHRNVHGVQFHPEKSHGWGATLLKNFSEM